MAGENVSGGAAATTAGGGAGSPPVQPVAARNAFAGVSFEIEIATPQNNNVVCAMNNRHLRGRFDMSLIKGRMPDDRFARCPTIPGVRMQYDGARRVVAFVDPLADPKNRDVTREIQAAVQAMGWPKPEPAKAVVYERVSDDHMKEWAYWARRWLDAGQCDVLRGTNVPSMDEIEGLPGRIERNRMDTSQKRERFPLDVPAYVPVSAARPAS